MDETQLRTATRRQLVAEIRRLQRALQTDELPCVVVGCRKQCLPGLLHCREHALPEHR